MWRCKACSKHCTLVYSGNQTQPVGCLLGDQEAKWKEVKREKRKVVCQTCGKEFEINYREGKTTLDCFKACPSCQELNRKTKEARKTDGILNSKLGNANLRGSQPKHMFNSMAMSEKELKKHLKDGDFFVE